MIMIIKDVIIGIVVIKGVFQSKLRSTRGLERPFMLREVPIKNRPSRPSDAGSMRKVANI